MWQEIAEAKENGREIKEKNIYEGVVSKAYYENLVTQWQWKFAYVLTPVREFKKQLEFMEHLGLQAMQDILDANAFITKQGGKKYLNDKVAKLQHDVFKTIMSRLRGKEIERKQVHTTSDNEKPASIDDINAQIEKLQLQAKDAAN